MYKGMDVPPGGFDIAGLPSASGRGSSGTQQEKVSAKIAIGGVLNSWARPEQIEFPFEKVWRIINGQDWTATAFSLEKAYACALFSKLAYLHVPSYELVDKRRIKVIPCLSYQQLVSETRAFDIKTFLPGLDFGQLFIVERRYAVIVGVQTSKVTFVSVRGTRYLYDWLTNLRVRKLRLPGSLGLIFFHRGFYAAIDSCIEPIREKLFATTKHVPVYVTGHSLGGAMAAIMHAISQREDTGSPTSTHSCYTYGMPRYGNFLAVAHLRRPYHVYNERDIVPSVPPRWMGYASCPTEFRTDGTGFEKVHERETLSFGNWIARLCAGSGIADHSMELYLENLAQYVTV